MPRPCAARTHILRFNATTPERWTTGVQVPQRWLRSRRGLSMEREQLQYCSSFLPFLVTLFCSPGCWRRQVRLGCVRRRQSSFFWAVFLGGGSQNCIYEKVNYVQKSPSPYPQWDFPSQKISFFLLSVLELKTYA